MAWVMKDINKITLGLIFTAHESINNRCPEQVENLRAQHMSKSCSVSYKNTGPLHISYGHKARLVDINGIEYLDTRNNVAHCGHGHPDIVRAITYQMEQLNVRYFS